MSTLKVLFIASSNDRIGSSMHQTGVWLEEIAAPYYVFLEAGASITMASPNGGTVPLDTRSESIIVATRHTKRFLKDPEAMHFLLHSSVLEEINANDFDVVYLPGGYAPLWDLVDNKPLKQLLEIFNLQDKLIGLVCHGVAALLSLQNDVGEPLIQGKQVTGFSNTEEEYGGFARVVPFFVETELIQRGAHYSKNDNYVSHVVADGNIITGQNAASSEAVAKKILLISAGRRQDIPLKPVMNS
jgi:putative intracellular protease/amidase